MRRTRSRTQPTPRSDDDGNQELLSPEKGPPPKVKVDGSRNLRGVFRSYDAETATLMVRFKIKGRDTDRAFPVVQEVAVFVAGQSAGLEDLRAGTELRLRLSENRRFVVEIRVGKE